MKNHVCIIHSMDADKDIEALNRDIAQVLEQNEGEASNLNETINEDLSNLENESSTSLKVGSKQKKGRGKRKAKKSTDGPPKKTTKKEIELPIKIDLIELVKRNRPLYNLKDPMHMNRTHKDLIWQNISDEMVSKYPDMEAESCRKMWTSIRESTR